MSVTSTCEGIVLKKKPLLNNDLSLVIFTKINGKQRFTLKGVQTLLSKRKGQIETGNLIVFEYHSAASGLYIQQVHLKSAFVGIKEHHNSLQSMYRALQLVDNLLPEEEPEETIYTALLLLFMEISKEPLTKEPHYNNFCNTLLKKLGYTDRLLNQSEIYSLLPTITERKFIEFQL